MNSAIKTVSDQKLFTIAPPTRLKIVLWSALYIFTFTWAYIHIVAVNFEYYGMKYIQPKITYWVVSVLFSILPTFWLPQDIKRPSSIACTLLYLVVYIPICIVNIFFGYSDIENYFIFLFFVCFGFFIICASTYLKPAQLKSPNIPQSTILKALLLIYLVVNLMILASFRNIAKLSDMSEIYTQREQYKVAIGVTSKYFHYLFTILINVVNVYFLAIGLIQKKYYYIVLAVLSQILIFSVTALKSSLLAFPFYLFIYLFLSQKHWRTPALIIGFVALLLATVLCYFSNSFTFLSDVVLRRFLTMQGQLTAYYFDFFSHSPKAYLGYSFLKPFSWYPYHTTPPSMIGQVYFEKDTMYANANFWADAYANFGYIGVLLYSVLLSWVLWVYDSVTSKKNLLVSSLLIMIFSLNICNTSLFVSLFTNSFLFTTLLMYLQKEDVV